MDGKHNKSLVNQESQDQANNNNNNLILRPRPSQTPNWCMRAPCLWDKGPPPHKDFTAKVYGGAHTLPPSGFESVIIITTQYNDYYCF
jgi:hypothetical protein